jgi:hypothetical protein
MAMGLPPVMSLLLGNKSWVYGSFLICIKHRLIINRQTKRGREKSPSGGHCQSEKEMDDHLLACQQILEIEPRSDMLS